MIYAAPGDTIEAMLRNAPTDLVGTLTVRVIDDDGTIIVPETTQGISEFVTGAYVTTIDLPSESGTWYVVWRNGTVEVPEELRVARGTVEGIPSLPTPGLTYASMTDFRTYAPEYAALDDAEVGMLLLKAERDVDYNVGPHRVQDNGRKFDPAVLRTRDAESLRRATCAQAQYRKLMGPRFFLTGQHSEVQGPDYTVRGKLPTFGPQAMRELQNGDLLKLTTTWAGRGDDPPWRGFTYG